jgi:putative flippase GtrA
MSSTFDKVLRAKTNNTAVQLLRYAFVGGLAFVVDFGSLFVLTEYARIHYLQSAALAFVLGLTTNYLLSIYWVFQKRTFHNKALEYGIFAVLGLLGLGLNQVLIYSLTELADCHYLLSKAVATAVVFFWNFGSRKLILFHYGPADHARQTAPELPIDGTASAAAVLESNL